MSFDPDKSYNDLPLLPPKAEVETKAVLRKAIGSYKALTELKGAGDLNPKLLDLLRERKGDMSKKRVFLHTFSRYVQDVKYPRQNSYGFR